MTGRSRLPFAALAGLATTVALVVSGCSNEGRPQTTLDPQGPQADKIHTLFVPVFGIATVVFFLIMGLSVYVAIRFRAPKVEEGEPEEFPEQVHGHFKMEIGWTILPAIVLLIVAIFTVATIFDLARKPTPEALKIEVYGQQWWWEYRYHMDVDGDGEVDEIITANDMVIPTGRQVALEIMSRDVIHSWWAPALNGKKDAVPGRVHPLTLEAPDAGEYIGQCTEFCGLSHAEMRIKVIALEPDDFQAWAERQVVPWEAPEGESAEAGWDTFVSQCTSCHRITGMTSPSEPDTTYEYPPVVNQVAGEVPNLTKFMTRTTFAGAKFDLRLPTDECKALGTTWAEDPKTLKECLNRDQLEAWLRNAPEMKAMAAGEVPSPESRGMNNFNLTEDQIDDLVAFLITLQ